VERWRRQSCTVNRLFGEYGEVITAVGNRDDASEESEEVIIRPRM